MKLMDIKGWYNGTKVRRKNWQPDQYLYTDGHDWFTPRGTRLLPNATAFTYKVHDYDDWEIYVEKETSGALFGDIRVDDPTEPRKCSCPLDTIMLVGCKCGGV